ncbi:MAG: 1-deoxy-D-xylulose-5-phosphate reductoisomerase [Firmicutes bacterium]|nr:1-deoxy-D-xylulose-5-phosphate reductoisomerase [Bacillota bacterium]
MKKVVVLGSTGSIGTQTLDVIRHFPDRFTVTGLAFGGARCEEFAKQIAEFKPKAAAVFDESALGRLKEILGSEAEQVRLLAGMEGLIELASMEEADIVVTSMVGMIGIRPTVAAIEAGKDIALANKETLACAGSYIMNLAKEKGVSILPVDSEHGAFFQCMQGVRKEDVRKLWLTASGGPFRGYTKEQLETVTLEQALKHPNWSMGAKITIDSATLMNKGIEMIEARWLYDVEPSAVVPVIHPQSLIHSMVELKDGSVLAQLGPVDMRLPIEVALFYPERGEHVATPLDFRTIGTLTFEAIDEEVFPSIAMARHSMEVGALLPAVFNTANEVAVAKFRRREIGFTDIYRLVEHAMNHYEKTQPIREDYTISDVLDICREVEYWI